MSEEKKEITRMEEFKKEAVRELKEAEEIDKQVINFEKIEKWRKIIHFAGKHIELCKAVVEKGDNLYGEYKLLWDAATKEDVKKHEEKVKELNKEFKKEIGKLLELKKRYKEEEELKDIKKTFKSLSKIPKLFIIE